MWKQNQSQHTAAQLQHPKYKQTLQQRSRLETLAEITSGTGLELVLRYRHVSLNSDTIKIINMWSILGPSNWSVQYHSKIRIITRLQTNRLELYICTVEQTSIYQTTNALTKQNNITFNHYIAFGTRMSHIRKLRNECPASAFG